MNIEKTFIKDLVIISPSVFVDDRGTFFESYNQQKFREVGINENFIQDNQSVSKKGVLRGLHYQKGIYSQAKLVRVIKGCVLDVAVDLRKNSDTYGQHFSIELNDKNNLMFFIPTGFAHGFIALEDNTIFSYKCSALYNKESEGGIIWNDTTLNIDWKFLNPLVSDKDKILPNFSPELHKF
ncbi:MAG: dTDP-4-dehydrorhamnose 3,5-epimerase [Bacteroidia bacterium]|nr:dTDP-4-dehydrorhamnose 3,5-epimerase [Bacteroidia bacterium]MCZ2249730.1 dTDP-4-dehydrorhamnose 3,5-epimerase [Bacteroidia bacterium]